MRASVERRVARAVARLRRARRPGLAVATLSFLEATVLPIPLEAVLVPVMQLDRRRLWRYAAAALAGFLPAALLGYAAGMGVLAWLVEPVMGDAAADGLARAKEVVTAYGFWGILLAGVTPIPFQAAMLAAGAVGYPLAWYLAATLLSRGLRYFGLALLVWWLGDRAGAFLARYRWPALGAVVVAAAAAVAWSLMR